MKKGERVLFWGLATLAIYGIYAITSTFILSDPFANVIAATVALVVSAAIVISDDD